MIKNRKIFTVLILLFSRTIFSQEIVTDRPDQTESSVTVGKHSFQIESGVLYLTAKNNTVTSFFVPSTLLRYGISENVELRFVSQYESTKIALDGGEIDHKGFNDLELGAKIQILKDDASNTEIAFLSHLIIPTAKENLTTDNIGIVNKLAISHTLSDVVGLGYNVGYDNVEEQSALTFSIALGVSLSEKVGFYVEPYGVWGESNTFESNFDAGITYLMNPNFQFDISYGTGLNNSMQYIAAGFSWKISNFLNKKKS